VSQIIDKNKKPPFKQVSPIVYWSSWAFAVMNILFLAPDFFVSKSNTGLSLVGLIPSTVWGFIFLGLGLSMISGLLRNCWRTIRIMLTIGLFVKAMFAWALVFTLFSSFASRAVVGIWIGMMVWQALCIIYFSPEMKHESNI
jgi:hypothetical protein